MKELLTAQELAKVFRVKTSTVRTWHRKGIIKSINVGGRVLRYDLDQILAQRK